MCGVDYVNQSNKKISLNKLRRINSHNGTYVESVFNENDVRIGIHTYGPIYVLNFDTESKLVVENYCSIAWDVFCLGSDRRIHTFYLYIKLKYWEKREKKLKLYQKGILLLEMMYGLVVVQ